MRDKETFYRNTGAGSKKFSMDHVRDVLQVDQFWNPYNLFINEYIDEDSYKERVKYGKFDNVYSENYYSDLNTQYPYRGEYDWYDEIFYERDYPLILVQNKLLTEILGPLKSPFSSLKKTPYIFTKEFIKNNTNYEQLIFEHIEKLSLLSEENLKDFIEEIRSNFDFIDLFKILGRPEKGDENYLISNLYLFSPFWIRNPEDWKGDGFKSLVKHLFVQYDVPKFLYSSWFDDWLIPYSQTEDLDSQIFVRKENLKGLTWFLILAQGGSLQTAAKYFGWNIRPKFYHYLQEAPSDSSIVVASIYAEILRLGGNQNVINKILQNPAFVVDTTQVTNSQTFPKFWEETILWLIQYNEQISNRETERVLHWAMHEFTESERIGGTPFSMAGRGLRRTLDRANEYIENYKIPSINLEWKAHGWDWEYQDSQKNKWTFQELTTSEELFQESSVLHHCVSSYSGRCASGYSAIVSLRKEGKEMVTIEINPLSKSIIQKKGTCNRKTTLEEDTIIYLWLQSKLVNPQASIT